MGFIGFRVRASGYRRQETITSRHSNVYFGEGVAQVLIYKENSKFGEPYNTPDPELEP